MEKIFIVLKSFVKELHVITFCRTKLYMRYLDLGLFQLIF